MDPDPGGQKHTDPTNPDPDSDPQNCLSDYHDVPKVKCSRVSRIVGRLP